jgi:hypothetical protein
LCGSAEATCGGKKNRAINAATKTVAALVISLRDGAIFLWDIISFTQQPLSE